MRGYPPCSSATFVPKGPSSLFDYRSGSGCDCTIPLVFDGTWEMDIDRGYLWTGSISLTFILEFTMSYASKLGEGGWPGTMEPADVRSCRKY
jgi:hypothetical protein